NRNTSYVGDRRRPTVRLPGSGGGADVASLAGRLLVIMPQERRRFRERVDCVTSPGFGEGAGWRSRVGLRGGGPSAVITTMGVYRFDAGTGEMVLASWHPGPTPESVRAARGWPLSIAAGAGETASPDAEELAIVRECDPEGAWTR